MNETTQPVKTKQIGDYKLVVFAFGAFTGWIAHEIYVAYQLSQMGLL